MKRLITIALFTLLMVAGPLVNADVRVMFDESTVLPGTPTGLTIVVNNPGKTALQLPPALWLVATDENVETFRVSAYDLSDDSAIAIRAGQRIVPPGESREFRFDPSSVLVGSPWFTDGRLSLPGKYRLRAVFAPAVDDHGEFNAAHALVSKEETLTIAVESDEDAAVWAWMKDKGRGRWGQGAWIQHPDAFSDFVMKNHPQSSYALYAVIFLPVQYHDRRDELLLQQANRFPHKSYSDQLKLHVAHAHRQAADTLRRSDLRAAADEAEAVRKLATELVERSRSSLVRAQAQQLLAGTPKREVWIQMQQPQKR